MTLVEIIYIEEMEIETTYDSRIALFNNFFSNFHSFGRSLLITSAGSIIMVNWNIVRSPAMKENIERERENMLIYLGISVTAIFDYEYNPCLNSDRWIALC